MRKLGKAAVDAAYELAKSQLAQVRNKAVTAGGRLVASTRDESAKPFARRSAGQAVVDAVVQECDAAVDRLIQAHVHAGHRDADAIAKRIRADFLDHELKGHPAMSFAHGSSASQTVATMRMLEQQTPHISAARGRLSSEAKHRAAIAVASAPNRLQRFTAWAQDNRLVVGGIILVIVLGAIVPVAKALKDMFGGCSKDSDCKGERVCEGGTCIEPTGSAPAPSSAPLPPVASTAPAPLPSAAVAGSASPASSAR